MALHACITTARSLIMVAPSIPRLSSDSTMQGSPSSTVIRPLRALGSPSSPTILSSAADAGSSPANHPMNVPSPAWRHSPGRVSMAPSSKGVSTTSLPREGRFDGPSKPPSLISCIYASPCGAVFILHCYCITMRRSGATRASRRPSPRRLPRRPSTEESDARRFPSGGRAVPRRGRRTRFPRRPAV